MGVSGERAEPVRTALYDAHVERGGHIVDFHGFELPIRYTSTIEEHLATRSHAGLFDVSHMGFFRFSGAGLLDWFDGLATQRASSIPSGRCAYTHFLDSDGLIIDDMIFAVTAADEVAATGCTTLTDHPVILGVPNASMIPTMWSWFQKHLPADGSVVIEDLSDDTAILALQGPTAGTIIEVVLGPENAVSRFRCQAIRANPLGLTGWIQGTGYTGEAGVEIFVSNDSVRRLWDALLDDGASYGVVPVGLGARDTLRLEKGYLLSGQDFLWPALADSADDAVPAEFLARDSAETFVPYGLDIEHEFIGRHRVAASRLAQTSGGGVRWLGLRCLEKGPFPRAGHAVLMQRNGGEPEQVGTITSGGPSPSLGRVGIGLAYLEGVDVGDEVLIAPNPRRRMRAVVVRPPFL